MNQLSSGLSVPVNAQTRKFVSDVMRKLPSKGGAAATKSRTQLQEQKQRELARKNASFKLVGESDDERKGAPSPPRRQRTPRPCAAVEAPTPTQAPGRKPRH